MPVQSMPSADKYSETAKHPLYENFRYCEMKNSRRFFDTRNFQKHRKNPLASFFVLSENIFSENRGSPLLHNFSIPETSRNTEIAPSRIFFLKQKVFTSFCCTPYRAYQNPCVRQVGSASIFQKY